MRSIAALVLIILGLIGSICLGFLATFTVGAISSDFDGVGSQVGAALVTATPVLCLSATLCGIIILKRQESADATKQANTGNLIVVGGVMLLLAVIFVSIGGPMTRIS